MGDKEHEKLQEDYKNKIISLLLISVLVTVFLLFISYFISNFLQEKFLDYEKALFEKEKIKFESIIKELRVIFDNLPMMLIYKDIENNILRVNKHVLDSLGKSIDELSNVPSKNIFPNDYEKYYEDDLEVIKTKKAKVCFIERL